MYIVFIFYIVYNIVHTLSTFMLFTYPLSKYLKISNQNNIFMVGLGSLKFVGSTSFPMFTKKQYLGQNGQKWKKLRALCRIKLLKLKKTKCLWFFHFLPFWVMGDIWTFCWNLKVEITKISRSLLHNGHISVIMVRLKKPKALFLFHLKSLKRQSALTFIKFDHFEQDMDILYKSEI